MAETSQISAIPQKIVQTIKNNPVKSAVICGVVGAILLGLVASGALSVVFSPLIKIITTPIKLWIFTAALTVTALLVSALLITALATALVIKCCHSHGKKL